MPIKVVLSPEEKVVRFNKKIAEPINSYQDAEQLFKKFKYRSKVWFHEDYLYLGKQGYKVIGIETIPIPEDRYNELINQIGPTATRLILAYADNDHDVDDDYLRDIVSFQVFDSKIKVSTSRPH